MQQVYEQYGPQDYLVWKTLFTRQSPNLEQHACQEFRDCLDEMSTVLHADAPPRFTELNELLLSKNGWSIEVVPGFLPVDEFFALLAKKRFCSSTWLRRMDQLDYLEEPDMFHDILGHIPLYMNSDYADYAQKLGELGVRYAANEEIITQLQRLYWFTIEFGVMKEEGETKIYGAGIASSKGEVDHIYNDDVEILPFDIEKVMANDFIITEVQNRYYEIESFAQLFDTLKQLEEILPDPESMMTSEVA